MAGRGYKSNVPASFMQEAFSHYGTTNSHHGDWFSSSGPSDSETRVRGRSLQKGLKAIAARLRSRTEKGLLLCGHLGPVLETYPSLLFDLSEVKDLCCQC